jgi:putative Mg2+ transporter-C (MgtC) family protein
MVLIQLSNGDQFHLYGWVLLGLLLGAIVGFEREYRGHEAGVRTTALVCAGATMFTQVSTLLGDSRVAAGVVQGIGFLGIGLMFQRGGSVKGVTTAATIWVMAAVGLLVGERLWFTATLVTVTLVALLELAPLSDWVLEHGRPHERPTPPRNGAVNDAQESTDRPE